MTGVPGVKTVPQLSLTEGTVGATTSVIQATVELPAAGSVKVGAAMV